MHHNTEKKNLLTSLFCLLLSSLLLSCLSSSVFSSLSVPVFFLCLCLSPCGVVVVMCCVRDVLCVCVLMCVCVSV